jgi:hypothetical protein
VLVRERTTGLAHVREALLAYREAEEAYWQAAER